MGLHEIYLDMKYSLSLYCAIVQVTIFFGNYKIQCILLFYHTKVVAYCKPTYLLYDFTAIFYSVSYFVLHFIALLIRDSFIFMGINSR